MYRLSDNIMPLFSMERFRGADGSRREKEPCKFLIIYATRSIAKDIFFEDKLLKSSFKIKISSKITAHALFFGYSFTEMKTLTT